MLQAPCLTAGMKPDRRLAGEENAETLLVAANSLEYSLQDEERVPAHGDVLVPHSGKMFALKYSVLVFTYIALLRKKVEVL